MTNATNLKLLTWSQIKLLRNKLPDTITIKLLNVQFYKQYINKN